MNLLYIVTTKSRVISGDDDESIVMSQPAHEEMESTSTCNENESEKEAVSISHSTQELPGQAHESNGDRWFVGFSFYGHSVVLTL